MRALLFAVGCVAFVGCTFGANTCKTQAECIVGTCDLQSGFCIDPVDSGIGGAGGSIGGGGGSIGGGGGSTGGGGGSTGGGGGSTGGGGGGSTGGGGGGSTGGGGGSTGACQLVTCFTGFECQAGANDAGVCVFSYSSVLLTQPASPGPYGGQQSAFGVQATLMLASMRAGVMPPSSISVEFSSDAGDTFRTLTWNGSAYAVGLDAGSFRDGDYLVTAFYDAGLPNFVQSTQLPFSVDNTGPRIAINALDGGLGPFKRDEVVPFVVSADEALSQASLTFDGTGQTAVTCPTGTCTPATKCYCFNVDMSQPPLPSLAGGFLIGATAHDLLMNVTATLDGGSANVTRVRWQKTFTSELLRAAPALGVDGTLYLGSQNGLDDGGTLLAVSPNGNAKLGWPAGGVAMGAVQSLAVTNTGSGEVVFYAANDSAHGVVGARLASNGTASGLQPECPGASGSRSYSGIGLMSANFGSGVETVAVGAIGAGTSARAIAYHPSDVCAASATTTDMAAPTVPTSTPTAVNVAIDGATASFIGQGGRVFVSTLTASWSVPTPFRLGTAGTSSVFSGSALMQNSGAWELALSGGISNGNLTRMTLPGGTFSTVTVGGNNRVGMPVLLPETGVPVDFIYAGVEGSPTTLDRFQLNQSASTPGPQTTGFVSAAPVLGANHLGYATAVDGQLTVFSTQSFSTTGGWNAALPTSSVVASPTLDCVRDAAGVGITGAKVGVLYVVSTTGEVTAILVDSPKLDTTANGWPKYQRTAGNAGNTDTSFGLNPGCPP